MKNDHRQIKNVLISLFVVVWLCAFHYESIRYYYLNRYTSTEYPKIKFLFPPTGWIMFFNVDETYGLAEVYGIKNNHPQLIDPHNIFKTKAIGYDNIHRNVLSEVLSVGHKERFCSFLERKFPEFETFLIAGVYYPSVIKAPGKKLYQVMYTCPAE